MNPSPMSAPLAGSLTATPLFTGNGLSPHKTSNTPRSVNQYPIEFTGSGSEYFRIWIVNLLLLLVTFGLYYPWAKVRKLRYVYGNTLIAGHPLDFHGNPRKMLRGFLLVSVLMVLYSVAGRVSPISGAVAGLIIAALWPALMRASMQFRLANTSWRGLRFGFTGSLKEAYMVFLLPLLTAMGVGLLSVILMALLPASAKGLIPVLAVLGSVIGFAALVPYVWWQIKQYQHGHYALGQLQTGFKASYGNFISVFFKTGLIGLLGMVVAGVFVGMVMLLGGLNLPAQTDKRSMSAVLAMVGPMFLGFVLVSQLVQGPYFISRMQNLVWTHTGNRQIRFKSHLALMPLVWLTLKNWALVLLTLGLYWPFAAMALARIKLQAVVVHARQDPELLLAQARSGGQDAAGDLAADLIGIDFGL
jgi:uncharacterized membrane protein YjgN (DUF898 family)